MDSPTSQILISDARRALDELRLADALDICCHLGLEERVHPTQKAYFLMLEYLERGILDEERTNMYRRFIRETHEALDHVERELHLNASSSLYSLSQRYPVNDFDRIFTLPSLSRQDADEITGKLDDDHTKKEEKCVILSAITLGLLYFFDHRKMSILLRYLRHDDSDISIRALTGAALSQIYWNKRFELYPEITSQWKGIDVQDFQIRLLLTLDTKKIEKSIREEIMPDVMKQFGRLGIDSSKRPEDIASQLQEAMTGNPDWSADENVHDQIAEKIQQIAAWQQQGADVYLGSLGAIKTKLAYFRTTANWFRPYNGRFAFLKNTNLCDSDKWTLEQIIASMPAQQQQMLEGLGISDASFPTEYNSSTASAMSGMSSYLQDLYRFFYLHPQHRDTINPFKCDLLLASYGVFDDNFSDAQTLQRIGLICMKHGDFREAVHYLERADLMKSDDLWTLGRLAFCHRTLGETDRALYYYRAMEHLDPENARNLCRIGECLIQQKQYDEAFRYLFKANYLSDDAPQTIRALAWCSLLTGQTEQAENFYAKLLNRTPAESDWLNAGHTALIRQAVGLAVERYTHISEPDNIFADDQELMRMYGFTDKYQAWIKDMVRQKKRYWHENI